MYNEIAGYLAGIAIAWSFVSYIRDIFLGKTKPERISWLIWAILGLALKVEPSEILNLLMEK